ncbi:cation:proton antiporter [uncultured Thiodictyon sp.]|uniref:cation:proton antiporter domain-containing protein n=1 Tax=uncultured Thiodictyon sp. TaxID=1846217 RepID=UPI0025F10669|nr:cation:proton antiporter [uncultured Thiodictyon sp.]
MPESPTLRLLRKRWPLVAALAIGLIAVGVSYRPGVLIGYLREQASPMELFTLVLFLIFALPPLCTRLRLPAAVGLLLVAVLLGPFVLDVVDPSTGTVNLFASLGRVFLMFIAGLEIDLAVFAAARSRSLSFGALTFLLPLAAGTLVGHLFGFDFLMVLSAVLGPALTEVFGRGDLESGSTRLYFLASLAPWRE